MKAYDFPEKCLRDIVKKAIEDGWLYELVFTEEGRRLWKGYPESKLREIIIEELKRR